LRTRWGFPVHIPIIYGYFEIGRNGVPTLRWRSVIGRRGRRTCLCRRPHRLSVNRISAAITTTKSTTTRIAKVNAAKNHIQRVRNPPRRSHGLVRARDVGRWIDQQGRCNGYPGFIDTMRSRNSLPAYAHVGSTMNAPSHPKPFPADLLRTTSLARLSGNRRPAPGSFICDPPLQRKRSVIASADAPNRMATKTLKIGMNRCHPVSWKKIPSRTPDAGFEGVEPNTKPRPQRQQIKAACKRKPGLRSSTARRRLSLGKPPTRKTPTEGPSRTAQSLLRAIPEQTVHWGRTPFRIRSVTARRQRPREVRRGRSMPSLVRFSWPINSACNILIENVWESISPTSRWRPKNKSAQNPGSHLDFVVLVRHRHYRVQISTR